MLKFQQKIFRCVGLWALSALALPAQADSLTVAANGSERLAVLDVSGAELNRKQSRGFAQALAKATHEQARFVVIAEPSLETYLKKRRGFSIFVADSVKALCKNLALDYLIVSTIQPVAASELSSAKPLNNLWQVTLRWLDGNTGQMTKIHTQECGGDLNVPEAFPLRALLASLLESPDIFVPGDDAATAMPTLAEWALDLNAPAADSLTFDPTNAILSPAPMQAKRNRRWLWYITGAALMSGGSALFLLKNLSKSGSAEKVLLPEPPDPPK